MSYPYDLIIIGGGISGCTAASIAVGFGARTLLVEKDMSGANGSWQRTIPVKALLYQARKYAERTEAPTHKFFDELLSLKEKAYRGTEHPERLKNLGVEMVEGQAVFIDSHTIEIEKKDHKKIRVRGRKMIIASGSSPLIPEVEGIGRTPYLTPDTLFKKTWIPERIIIVGAGPVGAELGQAWCRLGSQVTLLEKENRILPAFPLQASDPLRQVMESEGMEIITGCKITRVKGDEHSVTVHVSAGEEERVLSADRVLFATGRHVFPEKLKLKKAGVSYKAHQVFVDKNFRTNVRHIYAIGDITGTLHQAQMAISMARAAVVHALFRIPMRVTSEDVPRVVFTDPEVATIGRIPSKSALKSQKYERYRVSYEKIGRAVIEDTPEGWIHVYVKKWTGRIMGAHITGRNAGEMISVFTMAMRHGIPLRKIASISFPFSSFSYGIQKVAEEWHLSPQRNGMYNWLKKLFRLQGFLRKGNRQE
ncbi:NAD(P)/FAD-dependent oxidoreductase [Balneolaceae bacterium ANBcel3]|nr:NAD(P)/FAD-dependent oxidoreductase [Balneolaceae bacterium ANBcel3]